MAGLYRLRAYEYGMLNKFEDAEKDFKESIILEPKISRAYFGLANVQENLGKFDDAIKNIGVCIRLRPDYDLPYKIRAWLFLSIKSDFLDAIKDDDKVLEIKPDSTTYFYRGIAYFYLNQFDKGMEDVKKAYQLGFRPSEIEAGIVDQFQNPHRNEKLDFLNGIELIKPQGYMNYGKTLSLNVNSYTLIKFKVSNMKIFNIAIGNVMVNLLGVNIDWDFHPRFDLLLLQGISGLSSDAIISNEHKITINNQQWWVFDVNFEGDSKSEFTYHGFLTAYHQTLFFVITSYGGRNVSSQEIVEFTQDVNFLLNQIKG